MNNENGQEKHLKFAVLACDVVLFTVHDNESYVKLIKVDRPPYFPKGSKGFPGGLIDPSETAEEAVKRIINNKAGVDPDKVYIEQLYTFSEISRDPRGRVVAVSYLALVPWQKLSEMEKQNSQDTWWSRVLDATDLAYDHDEMLNMALRRLRSRISYTTLISKLLADEFTLGELEKTYSVILGESIDKRNFRKKIAKLGILKELPYKKTGESYRPAKLYSFTDNIVKEIEIL